MKLRVLALFTRALRIEARSHWTYLVRVVLLGVLVLALAETWDRAHYGSALGLRFFEDVMYANLLGLTLAGLVFFASAVSEEKEAQTLGLLRMTGLSALVLLLGKSTSRVLTAVELLLVQMPFTLLAVALGGMMPRQVAASYIALAAYLVFLANLALLFSVIVRRTYHASVLTGAALFVLLIVCAFHPWLSPIERIDDVLRAGWAGSFVSVQTWTNVGAGVGLFLLAWMLFDPCTRREGEGGARRRLLARLRVRWFAPGRAWSGPACVTWKDYHFFAPGPLSAVLWPLLIVAGFGVVVWLVPYGPDSWEELRVGFASVAIMASPGLLVLGTGWLVARTLQGEVRARTLPALVLTPLTFGQILRRKGTAVWLGIKPLIVLFLLGLALLTPEWAERLDDELRRALRWGVGRWVENVVEEGMPFVFFGAYQAVLYVLLVAYLALRVRHGPVVLAVSAQIGMFVLWVILFEEIDHMVRWDEIWFVLLNYAACVPIFILLALGFGKRLHRAIAA